MFILILFITSHSIVDVSTLLNRRSNSDTTVFLGMEKHGSHNFNIRDDDLSILGSGLTPMTGLLADTAYLFDIVNTSLTLGNLELSVCSRYRIAELDSESILSVFGSTIDLDEEYSPFLTNGGSIRLVDIALSGSSILPELVCSTNVDTHVIGSKISSDGVTVGTSPLFGAKLYSVELSHSAFSNIDHVVPNKYEPFKKSECIKQSDFPAFNFRTNFAFSKMRNVTDDIYGAITEASLVGDSFVYNTLRSEQQCVKTDVLQANKRSAWSILCYVIADFKIKRFDFDDIPSSEPTGVAGLVVVSMGDVKLTVSSCSFTNIHNYESIAGFAYVGVPISEISSSGQLIMKDCEFTNCTGQFLLAVYLSFATIEFSNIAMKSCSAVNAPVMIKGFSTDTFSKEGLTFRGCLFESCNCNSKYPHTAVLYVQYRGTITLCEQTTLKRCAVMLSSAVLLGVTVNIEQTRFVNCHTSTGRAAAAFVIGCKVFVEDVLLERCKALFSPNGMLISLYYNESAFQDIVTANEAQDYKMKNCYIERDTADDNSNLDVLFSIPESLLPGGKLDSGKFKKVHSNTGINIVGRTSTELSVDTHGSPVSVDESLAVSQKGSDPRTDKKKKDATGSGGGLSTGVIVTIVVVVIVVVVLVGVGIIVTVLLVKHHSKKKRQKNNKKSTTSVNAEMTAV
ncbi:hypothetical protein BLNAU_7719 [Blattamonas nauphoetae]|uniref:Uncharacterized protein n=1 Tax=Blattamonas nauphoetae TaxID=2049346 RepID=A0ABQ9Y0T1_9EUKA|nr:hypothetical protein BLNAU_7719 [Blattamonas nauphoetae]